MNTQVEIWGLAAGHGSTQDAARGAMTVRIYANHKQAMLAQNNHDWIQIISYKAKGQ